MRTTWFRAPTISQDKLRNFRSIWFCADFVFGGYFQLFCASLTLVNTNDRKLLVRLIWTAAKFPMDTTSVPRFCAFHRRSRKSSQRNHYYMWRILRRVRNDESRKPTGLGLRQKTWVLYRWPERERKGQWKCHSRSDCGSVPPSSPSSCAMKIKPTITTEPRRSSDRVVNPAYLQHK